MNHFIIHIFTISIIILLIYALIKREVWWSSSIIYRPSPNSSINTESLVTRGCIVHSKILFLPLFTDQTYSHWMVGLWTNNDQFVTLSTAASHSIVVRSIPSSSLQPLDSSHLIFSDPSHYTYIISNNETYNIKQPITLSFAISIFHSAHITSSYNFFTDNCQYQTITFLNTIFNIHHPNNIRGFTAFKACSHEIFSPSITKYSSKTKPKHSHKQL